MILTDHAIRRYKERVKPNLLWEQAKNELTALIQIAETIPEGKVPPTFRRDREYVLISDGIYASIAIDEETGEKVVPTLLIRGGMDQKHRQKRRQLKVDKRTAQRKSSKRKPRPYERDADPDSMLYY